MNQLAIEIAKNLLCEDPEIDFRIETGIETNRKGFASLELSGADGKPLERADITYRQLNHEYRFGCNAFMLEQFEQAEKNAAYERIFADLFNLAVVPFYWSDLEPEDGKSRFDRNSPPIYRRPPPDLCLEFCKRNHIVPKGHLLCWHEFVPKWAPTDRREMALRLERRIREIAARYAGEINIWDVANEAVEWWNPLQHPALPEHHVETAFRMAEKYFPESAELLYNEGPWAGWNNYHGDYTPSYMLVRHLLNEHLPVRGLGLQYHMFGSPENMVKWAGQFTNQRVILAHLDQYAKLGIPVNVSEISITGRRDLGDGDRFQELVAEKLYRLWFSHPATNGIIWWNLVDGTAAYAPFDSEEGENKYHGGLLNFDLSPKPAFKALRRLIKEEWMSSGSFAYERGKSNRLHGFYGDYELTIKTNSGTFKKNIRLAKESKNVECIGCN